MTAKSAYKWDSPLECPACSYEDTPDDEGNCRRCGGTVVIADGGDECNRCGSTFRIELCEVHRGEVPGTDRNRLEAYLCYSCRQETTHKVIG